MTPANALIRAGTPDDVPAIRRLLAAHGNDSAEPPEGSDIVGPYVRHLLAHHRVLVSELPGAGVVAFGAVADTGISWHLADLFVAPDRLGHGLGRQLLAELFDDRQPRTTFASMDPRALPSYVRAGMAARWVALYLRGGPDEAMRAAADLRARQVEIIPADAAELNDLERTWTGANRPADHAFWGALPGSDPMLIRDGQGPLAIAYGRDRQTSVGARALDRMVLRPGAEPVGTVLAAIARAMANGATLDVAVPGPHPALPVLLELGFRISDFDIYCAGPTDAVDPWRLLPNGGLL